MKKRILLVEDEAAVASYLGDFLEQEGFEVVRATTIQQANDLLESSFKLIMLDLMLPDGTGDELLPRIREAAPNVPVLMVTAAPPDDERLVKCLQAGAIGYVNKTARIEELIRHLRRALGE